MSVDKSKKSASTVQIKTIEEEIPQQLIDKYKKEVPEQLKKKLNYENVMEIPKLVKITVNRGVGEATQDIKAMDRSMEEFFIITKQKPVIRRAKVSIANFKVRQGQPIGVMVTLRGKRMYSFLEKLIQTALPRIRDFKGLNPHSFDGHGNYTFGIREQLIFPEIDYNKVDKIRGMNITICTTAKTDEEAKALLEAINFPFRK
ncbi:MAG: 50S ribosomal protein L5 [Caldisericia bacterium]|jgi:large subunit ribosomal protein L5|nr:50S ribosomal protein L5 [Caldisericia bacterium]